jgi:putative ABC transport system permease protein
MAALRETATEARAISRGRIIFGISLLTVGVAGAVVAATGDALIVPALLSAATVVVAAVALGPAIVGPAVRILGVPVARLRGVTGRLAGENAHRNPRRSAATATALVIGVAVVALFTVFTASFRATLDDDVTAAFGGDLVISTPAFGGGGLSPRMAGELREVPDVDRAIGLGGGPALLDGDPTTITATDLAGIGSVAQLDLTEGSWSAVGDDGMAVSRTKAEDEGWSVGSRVDLTFIDGTTTPATIRAVYDSSRLVGGVMIPSALWTAHNPQAIDRAVLVTLDDGVTVAAGRRALEPFAERYGGDLQDRDQYIAANTAGLDLLLNIVYVMLALAILIALLGIANTLSLAVYERRRELGLLRAVGQSRGQARSMLRWESVLLSTFGTLVGMVVGTFLGWMLFRTVTGDGGGSFALPVTQLAVAAVLGALAGMASALRPARRAARLPILDAIAAE